MPTKIGSEIAALHADGWSLDECLNELTKIRSDLHALLQPRPEPAQQGKGKGEGKGQGKDPKKGDIVRQMWKDDKSNSTLSAAMCIRYNKGICTSKACKFAHLCAIRLPSAQPCGQRHPAHTHRFKQGTPRRPLPHRPDAKQHGMA